MKIIILTLALVAIVQSASLQDVLKTEFNSFKAKHHKVYKNVAEELQRLRIFKDNLELIKSHNKLYEAGEKSYKMGVNKFTDMLPSEFQSRMLTTINRDDLKKRSNVIYNPATKSSIPSSVDWRPTGAVNPVKNQGSCLSCWAFSATGALESHYFLKTNQSVSLSEQNLVDCTPENIGCGGGWPIYALEYVRDNGGINTEESYPYEEKDGECRYDEHNIGARVSEVISLPAGDENALAVAVANEGPISVCIDASLFQYYEEGVFNEPECLKYVNHCIVVDGYGTDSVGGDFWLTRNSWGENWGERGYIRMARNRDNQCCIADYAIYPVV